MARTPRVSARVRRAAGLPERGPRPTNFQVTAGSATELFRAAKEAENLVVIAIMAERARDARLRFRALKCLLNYCW